MFIIDLVLKPWYIYRPAQSIKRIYNILLPPKSELKRLSTAWGGKLLANPTHSRGLAIHNTGIYDLAASEAIARLVDPGDTVVDGGANIGYMTLLAGQVAGIGGSVLAFEPHPALFSMLRDNTENGYQVAGCARFELHQEALGPALGKAWLNIPYGFECNDGLATLLPANQPVQNRCEVTVTTLDETLGERQASLLKLDIEGFEAEALKGAACALKEGRIRNVLFEDHALGQGEAAQILNRYGYEIFSLGWSCCKPLVQPVFQGILAKNYEAPNFIATLDSGRLLVRFKPNGWKALKDLTQK